MYKLAICDDNPVDTLYLQSLVSKWERNEGKAVEVHVFASAEAFLFEYEEDKVLYDIVSVFDTLAMKKKA